MLHLLQLPWSLHIHRQRHCIKDLQESFERRKARLIARRYPKKTRRQSSRGLSGYRRAYLLKIFFFFEAHWPCFENLSFSKKTPLWFGIGKSSHTGFDKCVLKKPERRESKPHWALTSDACTKVWAGIISDFLLVITKNFFFRAEHTRGVLKRFYMRDE